MQKKKPAFEPLFQKIIGLESAVLSKTFPVSFAIFKKHKRYYLENTKSAINIQSVCMATEVSKSFLLLKLDGKWFF